MAAGSLRPLALACLVLVAAAVGGCGRDSRAPRGGGAELRVTRDFGHELLGVDRLATVASGQTVMTLLRKSNAVRTGDGGRLVRAISGVEGGRSSGWFYWVNGLRPDVGPAEYELSAGDIVQWDLRDRRGARDVRAVVGAFPEPFVSGAQGKRFPVRVECESIRSRACVTVKRMLGDQGVDATGSALGASGSRNVVRVVVARWRRARELLTARPLELGPRSSGVFARFTRAGSSLELLDPRGRAVRDAAVGSGLVAALQPSEGQILWIVTGVDEEGVERAAGALRSRSLRDAFAVAVEPGGARRLPLLTKGRTADAPLR